MAFVPQLTVGTITVRSVLDPALDVEALAKSAPEGRPLELLQKHVEACGTSTLPAKAGERISEFRVRLLKTTEAAAVTHSGDGPARSLAWYARCVEAIDDCEDRAAIIDGVPLPVAIEIGSYAYRANTEVSRPFSSASQPAPSRTAAGSSAQTKRPKLRRTGTPKRT